jgi:uncharacterized membrane protein YfcA
MDPSTFVREIGPWGAVAACAVVALGAAVQGAVGFGLAILSAPLLMLIEPRLVPGPMLLCGFVLTLLIVHRERAAIDLTGLGWAVGGRIAGTVAAAVVLSRLAREAASVAFGSLVLLGVGLSALGLRLRPSPRNAVVAGTLSGFMGTVTSIGGPPMALIYQAEVGPRVRGTLAAFYLVGTVASLLALFVIGRLGAAEIGATLVLLPGIVLGFAVSARIAGGLDRRGLRPALLWLSGIAGVLVLVRGGR